MNGGGQLRASGEETTKELLQQVVEVYDKVPNRDPHDNPLVDKLYTDWLGGPDTDKSRLMLHTQYHEVEKMNTALNIKW